MSTVTTTMLARFYGRYRSPLGSTEKTVYDILPTWKVWYPGPVAQLGARFNRTEEVAGSNPARSTFSLFFVQKMYRRE